jgi:hypothetical protein
MGNGDIDPVRFGELTSQVKTLEAQVADLQADVKAVLRMMNESHGSVRTLLWVGGGVATLSTIVSGVVGFFVHKS